MIHGDTSIIIIYKPAAAADVGDKLDRAET